MLTWNNFEIFGFRKQIILKKLKLSPNFIDLWLFWWVTNDLLQWETSVTNNEWFFVTSNFCNKQQANSATSKAWISATSNFCREYQANFATSNVWFFATNNFYNEQRLTFWNEQLLQRVTSDFTTSNEQRVNFNEYRSTSEKLRLLYLMI